MSAHSGPKCFSHSPPSFSRKFEVVWTKLWWRTLEQMLSRKSDERVSKGGRKNRELWGYCTTLNLCVSRHTWRFFVFFLTCTCFSLSLPHSLHCAPVRINVPASRCIEGCLHAPQVCRDRKNVERNWSMGRRNVLSLPKNSRRLKDTREIAKESSVIRRQERRDEKRACTLMVWGQLDWTEN